MRVVLDTNVFVSGIFFGGKPHKILTLIDKKRIIPCFTVATFTELERVLARDEFIPQRKLLTFSVADFLGRLQERSLVFPTPEHIPMIIKEDPADNHLLACAIACQAFFLISGDKHLLRLKELNGIPIVPPNEFLKMYKVSS